jgi:hypothetical protein
MAMQPVEAEDRVGQMLAEIERAIGVTLDHGRPGLAARVKNRAARRLAPALGAGSPPARLDQLLNHREAAVRDIGAVLLADCRYPRVERLERARVLSLDDDWEVREWAAGPLRESVRDDLGSGLTALVAVGGRVRRAAVLVARDLVLERVLDAEQARRVADAVVDDPDAHVRKTVGRFFLGDAVSRQYPAAMASWLRKRARDRQVSEAFWKNVTDLVSAAAVRGHGGEFRGAITALISAASPPRVMARLRAFMMEEQDG